MIPFIFAGGIKFQFLGMAAMKALPFSGHFRISQGCRLTTLSLNIRKEITGIWLAGRENIYERVDGSFS